MKCYRMHEDLRITSMLDGSHPTADAVTIYQGYAVCQEHLEEMEELEAGSVLATRAYTSALDTSGARLSTQ